MVVLFWAKDTAPVLLLTSSTAASVSSQRPTAWVAKAVLPTSPSALTTIPPAALVTFKSVFVSPASRTAPAELLTKMALRVVLSELSPVRVMSPVALSTMVPVPPSTLAPSAIVMLDPFMTMLPVWLSRFAVADKFRGFKPLFRVKPLAAYMLPVKFRP